MNIVLWVLQLLFGVLMTYAGFEKFFEYEKVFHQYAWVRDVSPALVSFIGACEILGGLGLVLPSVTRIFPKLTALAAAGLLTMMILAAGFHVMRGEFHSLIPVTVLGVLFAFIAYGRFKLNPIQPKNH